MTTQQQQPAQADATTPRDDAPPADLDLTALLTEADAPGEAGQQQQAKADEPAAADAGKIADDAAAAGAKAPEDDAASTTTPATSPTAKDGTAAEATAAAAAEASKPGTPDKALQRMQQDLSAAQRKIDELNAKVDAGAKLSGKEQAQQQQAQRSVDKIRDALAAAKPGEAFDVLDQGNASELARSVLENDQSLAQVREEVKAARAELAELKQGRDQRANDASWRAVQQEYAGVNVATVWDKSVADTMAAMGVDEAACQASEPLGKAVLNAASRTFHQRADAAKKSAAGKTAQQQQQQQTTTKPTAPVTPGGGRVSQSSGVVNTGEPSEDAQYVKDAMALLAAD